MSDNQQQPTTSGNQRTQTSKVNSKVWNPPSTPPRLSRNNQQEGRNAQQKTAESNTASVSKRSATGSGNQQQSAENESRIAEQKGRKAKQKTIEGSAAIRSATESGNQQQSAQDQQQPLQQQQQSGDAAAPGTPNRQATTQNKSPKKVGPMQNIKIKTELHINTSKALRIIAYTGCYTLHH